MERAKSRQSSERIASHPMAIAITMSPTPAIFLDQLALVESYADLRPDRAAEIVSQLGVPHAFFGSIAYLHPERTRWTMELIYTALRFAYTVVMRIKYALACRRPHEYSPQIQPIIACPLHGSLPSGHATEAFMFAHLLAVLSTDEGSLHGQDGKLQIDGKIVRIDDQEVTLRSVWVNQLMRQAARIAINRTVAGVHFPVDSVAGILLGLTLAEYVVRRCAGKQYGEQQRYHFIGTRYPKRKGDGGINADFNWQNFYDVDARKLEGILHYRRMSSGSVEVEANEHPLPEASRPLKWLWERAKSEWSATK